MNNNLNKKQILDKYKIDQVLSKKGNMVVQKCNFNGQDRVVKVIDFKNCKDKEKVYQDVKNEIDTMQVIKHRQHIVELLEYKATQNFIYIVTEYLRGNDLLDEVLKVGQMHPTQVQHVLRQILLAMAYANSLKFTHRNLKCENVIFTSEKGNEIKICDFRSDPKGLENITGKPDSLPIMQTPPEFFNSRSQDYKFDIWSIGVIFYIMMCGRPPFLGKDDKETVKMIKQEKVSFTHPEFELFADRDFHQKLMQESQDPEDDEQWNWKKQPALDLCRKLLHKQARRRQTQKEALNHPQLNDPTKLPDMTSFKVTEKDIVDMMKSIRKFSELSEFGKVLKISLTTYQTIDNEEFKNITQEITKKREALEQHARDTGKTRIDQVELYKLNKQRNKLLVNQMRKVFNKYDKDQSGSLDKGEFAEAMRDLLTLIESEDGTDNKFDTIIQLLKADRSNPTPSPVNSKPGSAKITDSSKLTEIIHLLWEEINADKGDEIEQNEFLASIIEINEDEVDTQADTLFEDIDCDREGTIDHQELQGYLKSKGVIQSNDAVSKAFQEVDEDESGSLDKKEFKHIFNNIFKIDDATKNS